MKYRETGSQNLMGSFLTQNTTQLIPVKKFNGAKANNTHRQCDPDFGQINKFRNDDTVDSNILLKK
jgi:hypothetical protein